MVKRITANWTLELNVTCPHCKETIDLLEDCDFWEDKPNSFAILHLEKQKVYCPECNKTFTCDFDY